MARELQSRLRRRWWPLLLAMAVLCAACKKQEDERSSITGNVSTPQGDVGGVTVEMYAAGDAFTAGAWGGTALHPDVGFLFDLPAAWDYRRQSAQLLASFTTGANGTFEFPDVADGDYILSARKNGYGWSPPRAVTVRGRSVNAGTLALAEEETLPANAMLTGETTWLSGRHYILPSTVTVAAGVTLTIEPGAVVRLAWRARINVQGALVAEGEPDRFILFTSNEPLPSAGDWWYIVFSETASPPSFRYCAFRYGEDAVRTDRCPGGRIEYCYFGSFSAQGVSLGGTADAEMDSIVFRRNVANNVPLLLEVNNVPAERPLLIERNAVSGSTKFGVDLLNVQSGAVRCNWFYDCGDTSTVIPTGALHLFNARNVEVHHNDFRRSRYGVDLGSRVDSSVHIRNNYFYLLYVGLHVGYTSESHGPSFPRFNYNCLRAITSYHLHLDACLVNTQPIDATNNYWDGLSGSSLQSKIYDHNDEDRCPYVTVGTILPSCDRTQAGLCGM